MRQIQPADYRVPANKTPGHVYVSTNSRAWNPTTAGQGHTVALGPGVIASEQGRTVALIPPEPVPVDPDSTVVLATAPAPRVNTVAEVERELRRPARQDPPIYTQLIAMFGLPKKGATAAMHIPDSPTQTIRVAELVPGDQLIVPMVGNVETVLSNKDGTVSTDGTGPDSAYMWNADDSIHIVSRGKGGAS